MTSSILSRLGLLLAASLALVSCKTQQTQSVDQPDVTESSGAAVEERSVSQRLKQLDIQGHRGARGLEPENTLPSFEAALDLEVDTLELDLHFSKDGRAVIWHDAEVEAEHCSGRDGKERRIRMLTAEELSEFQCDRNPDPERFPEQENAGTALAGSNYSIVTLGELFEFVERYAESPEKSDSQRESAARVRFNIETKRKTDRPETIGDDFDGEQAGAFEREVVRVVREHGLVGRVTLQSFDHRSVWAARELEPDMTFAVLEGERRDPLASYAERGADIWSPKHTLVAPATVEAAHKAGLKVIPWTVNDTEDMRRLIELGVDGIITDRPDLLVDLR